MTTQQATQLITFARSLLGLPYKYGAYAEPASDTQAAFDCSSFIQFVFHNFGIELPRSSILQAASEGEVIGSLEHAQPGDVLFFESVKGHYDHRLFPGKKMYIGHLGLYVGDNKMIHSTEMFQPAGVVEHDLEPTTNPVYNKDTIVLIKRYI